MVAITVDRVADHRHCIINVLAVAAATALVEENVRQARSAVTLVIHIDPVVGCIEVYILAHILLPVMIIPEDQAVNGSAKENANVIVIVDVIVNVIVIMNVHAVQAVAASMNVMVTLDLLLQ